MKVTYIETIEVLPNIMRHKKVTCEVKSKMFEQGNLIYFRRKPYDYLIILKEDLVKVSEDK